MRPQQGRRRGAWLRAHAHTRNARRNGVQQHRRDRSTSHRRRHSLFGACKPECGRLVHAHPEPGARAWWWSMRAAHLRWRANKNGSLVRDEVAVILRGTTHVERMLAVEAHSFDGHASLSHAPIPEGNRAAYAPSEMTRLGFSRLARERTSANCRAGRLPVAGLPSLCAFAAYSLRQRQKRTCALGAPSWGIYTRSASP